jgi:hypothetical protein
MQKYHIDSTTLILAALAATAALTQLSNQFAWMSSIGGLILVVVLFAFDQEGYRSVFQSLAFSAVCGFCTAIAAGAIYQVLGNHGEVHLANGQWATEYVPLTCAFATGIFWAIDAMRMNARKVAPIQVGRALGDTSMFPGVNTPAPEAATASVPSQPVFVATRNPPPVPAAEPVYSPTQYQEQPVQAAVDPEPPVRARELPTATSLFTVPQSAPTEPQPLQPGPAPIIPRSGKETMIYVSLLGEGLNVLRSVRAEPLGRDYYRIIDDMPEGETWQFQPGQVVCCKKKNLSSGKAMVAMEEAPRAT